MAGAAGIECPICRTRVVGPVEACPTCGAALPDRALWTFANALGLDGDEDETPGHPVRPATSRRDATTANVLVLCPTCGALVSGDDAQCGTCGVRLIDGTAGAEALVEQGSREDRTIAPKSDGASGGPVAGVGIPQRDDLRMSIEAPAEGPMEVNTAANPPAPPRARAVPGPRKARAPRRTDLPPHRSPVDTLRDVAFLVAFAALVPTAYATQTASEVVRWANVAVIGSLLAWTYALTFVDRARLRRKPRTTAIVFGGGILLLLIPLHRIAGIDAPGGVDVGVLLAGLTSLIAGSVRARQSPDVYMPWVASLPASFLVSVEIAIDVPMGPPEVVGSLWVALGGALALSGVLVLRRRWVSSRVDDAVRRAQEMSRNRDYRGSLAVLDRAIRIAGDEGAEILWSSKGATLVLDGRYEEAVTCIDTALRMNPRNELAWVNKGNALARMGRLVDALKCYNSAIKVNPAYEVAWNNKGNALARLGRFEEALPVYERALEIDRRYRGAWVNKGYVHTKLGDYEAAAQCADEVLRLDGRTPVATG